MITPQDIADAFNKAGIDSPELLSPLVANLANQIELQKVLNAIDGLAAKQAEAIKPIVDARIALQNRKNELAALIGTAADAQIAPGPSPVQIAPQG